MWEWNAKSQFFKTKLAGDLALRLDWVAGPSSELTEWLVWTFCLVVLQLVWRFSFSACFTRVHHLAACQSPATHEIQSRVLASVTLSHTLPLHDSHLNTELLIDKIQANLTRNKANKMVDKISTLQSPPLAILWQNSKTNSRLNMWVRNSWTKLTYI